LDDHREGDAPVRPHDVFPLTLRTRLASPEQPATPERFERARTAPVDARHLAPLFVGLGLVVVVIAVTIYGFTLSWTGDHPSPVALGVLRTTIIGGAAQFAIYGLAALALIFLLARRPTRRRLIVGGASIAGGAIVAGIVLTIVGVTNVLGVSLSATMSAWIVAGFAVTALGIASFWAAKGWRTIGVAFSIVFVLLAGTLGVNADFGLDPTIGALAGVSTLSTVTVPVIHATPTPTPTLLDGGALWANWVPDSQMMTEGVVHQVVIPGTISGFTARPAGIYYPPAAFAKNAPALPLVIMMMGQPGNPDPSWNEAILDQLQAQNHGLAPIVLVADQIGNPAVDPLCLNTAKYGNAETYVTQDVVNWARTHLHVLQDPAHWTIAGYSNGGECAVAFGAKYPNIWGNVVDVSGEPYPGSNESGAVLSSIFHGDSAAYQATWPVNIMATKKYADTVGIFTVGSNDGEYRKAALSVSAAATAAGWKTSYFEIPGGGHVATALSGGLADAYSILYPRLGLSKPATTSTPAPTSTSPG
jgi:poly(3-hydroxybutyrate) depolymerase